MRDGHKQAGVRFWSPNFVFESLASVKLSEVKKIE